mmetsp:Transcript_3776/g.15118  ORF Transcript_3776/g.15118 Transcript_3776/m.15118 type:complete len:219 (-) Transcript_3776:84-740(-)
MRLSWSAASASPNLCTNLVSACIFPSPFGRMVYAFDGSPDQSSCAIKEGASDAKSVKTWLFPFCHATGFPASLASVTTYLYTKTPSTGSSSSSETQTSPSLHFRAGDARKDHDPMLSCPPTIRSTSPNSTAFSMRNCTLMSCTVSTVRSSSYIEESSSIISSSIAEGPRFTCTAPCAASGTLSPTSGITSTSEYASEAGGASSGSAGSGDAGGTGLPC